MHLSILTLFFVRQSTPMDSEVQTLKKEPTFKRTIGTAFVYGYAVGTLIGAISCESNKGLRNSISRLNLYSGLTAVKVGFGYYLGRKILGFMHK